MGCSNILKIGREFALDGLPLPRLPAGWGWKEPCVMERPAELWIAAGCARIRNEPAALRVRPNLAHWPVADSHARS